MTKAISLLSGGLDSILATRLILDQGIGLEAVNFKTVFSDAVSPSRMSAEKLGIKLKVFDLGEEYFDILKNPRHGYGSNINPCLDCHIYMIKKAADYMKEIGAEFIITGEVVGERPMSQRKDALRIIDRDSGMKGLILRPLSALVLPETLPEKKGLVDRSKLLAIQGRSRKPQLELAKRFSIDYYLSPAGGCLLTDPGFAGRMKNLMLNNENFSINDIELLKLGRHFQLSKNAKFIVGRNEKENNKLINLAREGDLIFYPQEAKGPTGIARGAFAGEDIAVVASAIARYSDSGENEQLKVAYKQASEGKVSLIAALPATEEMLNKMRI